MCESALDICVINHPMCSANSDSFATLRTSWSKNTKKCWRHFNGTFPAPFSTSNFIIIIIYHCCCRKWKTMKSHFLNLHRTRETFHIFHTFQNALKLYIWSTLSGLTASTTATSPQYYSLLLFFFLKCRRRGSDVFLHAISPRWWHFRITPPTRPVFPFNIFLRCNFIKSFLSNIQTNEWTMATTTRENKKKVEIRQTLHIGFGFEMVNLFRNAELLFYFMRCIGESIIIIAFTFRADEGREGERENVEVCVSSGIHCFASYMVWPVANANMRDMQTCLLRYCAIFHTMEEMLRITNRNYTHMHKHQAQ